MTTSLDASPLGGPDAPTTVSWFRRRAVIVTAAVVAILAITVITDLPAHQSRSSDLSTARSIMLEIETDVAPCNEGVTESFGFYADVTTGHISSSDRAMIPGLIRDDLEACSFTSEEIVDLASIQVSTDRVGRVLNTLASDSLTWCDPAGLTAIGEITNLIGSSRVPAKTEPRLALDETNLIDARRAVVETIAKLDRLLGTKDLPAITLKKTP
jgi:hypothetical protein